MAKLHLWHMSLYSSIHMNAMHMQTAPHYRLRSLSVLPCQMVMVGIPKMIKNIGEHGIEDGDSKAQLLVYNIGIFLILLC